MPRGTLKTEQEIRQLLTIVDYREDNFEGRSQSENRTISGIGLALRWVLGTDDDQIEDILGSLESINQLAEV